MAKVVYWSEDDGAVYLPEHLDDAPNDGSAPVQGYQRYEVPEQFTLKAEDLCTGSNDIMNVLMSTDPPLAKLK